MFLGHFALAFAARRAEKGASLGTFMAAAQFPDLIWPYLLLAGVERVSVVPGDTAFTPLRFDSYPISHSLVTLAGWGVLFGAAHWWQWRRARAALLLGLLVVSHWLLDWVTHRPDLPVAPGLRMKYGLGLWNSIAGTLAVETTLFIGAVWLYLRDTRPRDGVGRYAMAALLALLVVIYLAAAFGPAPPSARAVALSTTPAILFAFWASWADRHRVARS
jgi:hypothetical protein